MKTGLILSDKLHNVIKFSWNCTCRNDGALIFNKIFLIGRLSLTIKSVGSAAYFELHFDLLLFVWLVRIWIINHSICWHFYVGQLISSKIKTGGCKRNIFLYYVDAIPYADKDVSVIENKISNFNIHQTVKWPRVCHMNALSDKICLCKSVPRLAVFSHTPETFIKRKYFFIVKKCIVSFGQNTSLTKEVLFLSQNN